MKSCVEEKNEHEIHFVDSPDPGDAKPISQYRRPNAFHAHSMPHPLSSLTDNPETIRSRVSAKIF